jgi:hypothetical protein
MQSHVRREGRTDQLLFSASVCFLLIWPQILLYHGSGTERRDFSRLLTIFFTSVLKLWACKCCTQAAEATYETLVQITPRKERKISLVTSSGVRRPKRTSASFLQRNLCCLIQSRIHLIVSLLGCKACLG